MKQRLLQWLGLDIWMRGIERAVGESRILIQERVRSIEDANTTLREENHMLLQAFIALKVEPPKQAEVGSTRKIPAARLVQEMTAQAFALDRER